MKYTIILFIALCGANNLFGMTGDIKEIKQKLATVLQKHESTPLGDQLKASREKKQAVFLKAMKSTLTTVDEGTESSRIEVETGSDCKILPVTLGKATLGKDILPFVPVFTVAKSVPRSGKHLRKQKLPQGVLISD